MINIFVAMVRVCVLMDGRRRPPVAGVAGTSPGDGGGVSTLVRKRTCPVWPCTRPAAHTTAWRDTTYPVDNLSINSVSLSVCQYLCLSVNLSVCNSVCLYLTYLASLSNDRLRARPVCCAGPDNVHCPV